MKHHFADFLDRTNDYWNIVPNKERYAYATDAVIADKASVKIMTISKSHINWEQVLQCPNIEELTLHDAGKNQVEKIQQLKGLKRLRVTFLRTKDISFLEKLPNLEEVILEYVSGFSDLSPLTKLTKLKSLHLENLRGVSNFNSLKGISSLRYLHIDGTLDWKQPIQNFTFLTALPNLEVFSLGFIISNTDFPALLPLIELKKIKKINIGRATFTTNEYAFLEAALPQVEGCSWDLWWDYDGNYAFLGKRGGYIKKSSPNATARCEEFTALYYEMKKQSEEIVQRYRMQTKL